MKGFYQKTWVITSSWGFPSKARAGQGGQPSPHNQHGTGNTGERITKKERRKGVGKKREKRWSVTIFYKYDSSFSKYVKNKSTNSTEIR